MRSSVKVFVQHINRSNCFNVDRFRVSGWSEAAAPQQPEHLQQRSHFGGCREEDEGGAGEDHQPGSVPAERGRKMDRMVRWRLLYA